MCFDPISAGTMAAGAALSGTGGYLSAKESADNTAASVAARNAVLQRHLNHQKAYADEASGFFKNRMADYAPGAPAAALTAAQDARTADATGAITKPVSDTIALPGSTPDASRNEIAKRMLTAYQTATDRAKAAAKLGGYGDTSQARALGVADTGRRLGTVGALSQGDMATLQDEQELADAATPKKQSIWGPVLTAGGNAVSWLGGSGKVNSWLNPPPETGAFTPKAITGLW